MEQMRSDQGLGRPALPACLPGPSLLSPGTCSSAPACRGLCPGRRAESPSHIRAGEVTAGGRKPPWLLGKL